MVLAAIYQLQEAETAQANCDRGLWTFAMASSVNGSLDVDAQLTSAQLRCSMACQAIKTGKCLEMKFDDCARVLEVHRVGVNSRGNHILSGWQILGPTCERVGWKLIDLEKSIDLSLTDIASQAPRPDYRKGTKQFIRIICQL
jgi:hypothetical protein